ncbi:MAG: tRNA pseudouridine(55) synthase TruB [Flavobacteriales bacterium]
MTHEELVEKGIVWLIDKPFEWTSFDAVNKLKGCLKHVFPKSKIKIGHAGTLDPLATGLLVICAGKATKKIAQIQDAEKEYTGTFYLGATTPSYDRETGVDNTFDISAITLEMIKEAASSFLGEHIQTAPAFSARKVDGKRAYEMARKGVDPGLKPHQVFIREFEIMRFEGNEIDFRVSCSKGTYIRTMANDLGKKLNNGAYLIKLVRTRIGEHELKNAVSPEEMVARIKSGAAFI